MLTKFIPRWVNIAALTAATSWLVATRTWPALIATILSLGSMLVLEAHDYRDRLSEAKAVALMKKKLSSSDRALFAKYVEHCGGSVYRFLREQDMGAAFVREYATPFHEYLDTWKGPQFEFVDRELEECRTKLHQELKAFIRAMLHYTFSDDTARFYTMGFKDAETRPEMFEARDLMNTLGHSAADAYEEFVRVGRRRLREDELSQPAQPRPPVTSDQ